IIAGMSLGTLVVEAANRSGALITARMAMEDNRHVMAVPGKIDSPMSEGPNKLIKDGAALIESVEDILEVMGVIGQRLKQHVAESVVNSEKKLNNSRSAAKLNLNEHENVIFGILGKNPLHIEQIIADTGLKAGKINACLISLRLKGLIKQQAGNFYVRSA
ncbi:MAG TPA: DNA-processing protein DprA, partial [Sedimentisphaerales bacterium]|nr:DNA-processing protein DprA [Sedimentisphaerales bacterium]